MLLQIIFLDEIKLQLACQEGVIARDTLVRVLFIAFDGRVLHLRTFLCCLLQKKRLQRLILRPNYDDEIMRRIKCCTNMGLVPNFVHVLRSDSGQVRTNWVE